MNSYHFLGYEELDKGCLSGFDASEYCKNGVPCLPIQMRSPRLSVPLTRLDVLFSRPQWAYNRDKDYSDAIVATINTIQIS